MAIYSGFSTVNPLSQKNFRLTDYELIKQDLLNSINTRKGTRVMQPNEGCVIWELLYEPLTQDIQQQISDNFTYIVNSDPRLQLISINLTALEDQNYLLVEVIVNYVATNQTENLQILFDIQNTQAKIV